MTLPPERIGDKGQRYVAWLRDWPKEGWNAFGYANEFEDAASMCDAMRSCPGVTAYKVQDRVDTAKPDYVIDLKPSDLRDAFNRELDERLKR